MRVGVLLPTFQDTPQRALAVAHAAADAGLDGVFAYDHLWPMGSPERPALSPLPLLARVAATEPRLFVGPLVARVGLVGAETLAARLAALGAVAPGRVIAALGTGDRLSAAEDLAYGRPVLSAGARRAELARVAADLAGVAEVWVGAGAAATNALARALGATLNLWDQPAAALAAAAADGPVCWAGPATAGVEDQLAVLAAAGATWAVFASPVDLARLAAGARAGARG